MLLVVVLMAATVAKAAMAALAGSNYIHHAAGFLESLLTVAYEQYVIDDDINGSILRAVRGIEVNDETLSVAVIDQVCKGEGHYLGAPQSLALMNTEYYYPHTADRKRRQDWEEAGSLDMREVAMQRAEHGLRHAALAGRSHTLSLARCGPAGARHAGGGCRPRGRSGQH